MSLLAVDNIKKSFGTDMLFENVCFEVAPGDKIGFIGANGTGKTTLFNILAGVTQPDEGTVSSGRHTRIGYMAQSAPADSEAALYEEVLSVFAQLLETERQLEYIARDIERKNGDLEALVKRQHALQSEYERGGGFTYKSRTRAALLGLGFSEGEFAQPFRVLSGGQKTRAQLAKLLLSDTNLLLLDEPTNHLDIQAVEWLEDFLKNYAGAFIVISHDRYFLDKVTRRTFELFCKKLNVYDANYSGYLQQKKERSLAAERRYVNTQKEISRLEAIVEQQRRWNREKNIKTAESKQKVIDKLKSTLTPPEKERKGLRFHFEDRERGGNEVLSVSRLSKSFGGKVLFFDVDIDIRRGERVFLLGPNGCGKTTLFKIIMGLFPGDAGEIKLGANVRAGYYDQAQSDLNPENTALEEVYEAYPEMDLTAVRTALAAFLFRDDEVKKKISCLSGGEKSRIALLKLMLSRANLLLLDEPTNHLDINSREALEQAFANYRGTLFVISHDRYFINKMADRILRLNPDGITSYSGNYDDYAAQAALPVQAQSAVQPKVNEYMRKKESESARRRLQGRIERTEAQIEEHEQSLVRLEEEASRPENAADYEKTMDFCKKIDDAKQKIEELYRLWDELHRGMEEL